MAGSLRYLTKSRFKLAAECPRKLFYTGKPGYLDRSLDDSFLAALAEGGYQVGELACLMHPGGIRVDDLDHQAALARTAELLQQEEVTIFEAALAVDGLFVRVDILRKQGTRIELIEVKAKSYSAVDDGDFRGARGQLRRDFLPYLQDVAFQRHVVQQALPGLKVSAFLMLADKDQVATVDGLNQRFKARRVDGRLRIDVAPGTAAATLGAPLLAKVNVDSQVDQILAGPLPIGPDSVQPFVDAVKVYARAYAEDQALPPIPTSACAQCAFKADHWPAAGEPRSGFHECWSQAFGWSEADFANGTVLDLWNFRNKDRLIQQGVLKPGQVQQSDLGFDGQAPGLQGMTAKHRQWYACQSSWPGGGEFYFDADGFLRAARSWRYPLHFIDFETSAVAIPFVQGRRPYEITAFQFSHHTLAADGRVKHQTQWLSAEPGVDPNLEFVRALREALVGDSGTIFRWSNHEDMVLMAIRQQLLTARQPPSDMTQIVAFIESICKPASSGTESVEGSTEEKGRKGRAPTAGLRCMVDLCDIASRFYFHPSTLGSNSLKKVLPALMVSSSFLRQAYGRASYGGPGLSLNFERPVAWWQQRDGQVIDPYRLLPPVFDDLPADEAAAAETGLADELREGGAAMAAYARLQFEDLPGDRREAMKRALLRYCELDTLAMVMAVQAWMDMARA